MFSIPLLAIFLTLASGTSSASKTWNTLEVAEGKTLEYALVTPANFDPALAYPVLIALPPGPQNRAMVETGLELYFEEQATQRGWLVFSPAAPEGTFFHDGATAEFDALYELITSEFKVAGGLVHLAGVSNGGRSSFHQAGRHPERFATLSALPGLPATETDWKALDELARMPVAIWAGEQDSAWVRGAERAARRLSELGAPELHLSIQPGESHVLDSKLRIELFDRLDYLQARQMERIATRASVAKVLDNLHDAADKADEERYFSLFAPGAIFIGTDATERWTVAEFRAYAKEPFARESAWTYAPIERHIELSNDSTVAWFDERLVNAKYGETRGSGVLVQAAGVWRIAHYVLSFSIPNDTAANVVEAVSKSGD